MQNTEILRHLSDDQILEVIGEISSLFHKVIPIVNTIAVTDREKFVHYFRGSEDAVPRLVGKKFPNSGNIPLAIQRNEQQIGILPEEIYGVAFKAVTIPLKNYEGYIIGTLSLALSLKTQTSLQAAIDNISNIFSKTTYCYDK
ncbi:MAG TPA: hypothetical protein DD730_00825 [Desulfosporosinus sp.]|jgi:hypothetical protein|nr:hypothetical protein [Desulfosporosinus sp.]